MHTGTAVTRAGDWYGTTVNVAARLCGATGGGQVLVSECTRRAAGRLHGVQLADSELHWLKNVTEPVPARLAFRRECPHLVFSLPLFSFKSQRSKLVSVDAGS